MIKVTKLPGCMSSKRSQSKTSVEVSDDDVWPVLDAYFEDPRHALAALQTESFDNFVERRLPLMIEVSRIRIPHEGQVVSLSLSNPRLLKPMFRDGHGKSKKLWPSAALSFNHSYVGNLIADIHYTGIGGQEQIYKDEIIGSIPIMVGSRWCTTYGAPDSKLIKHHEPLKNPGGYFIVRPKAEDGSAQEKVIIIHERAAHDKTAILRRGANSKLKVFFYAEVKSHDAKTLLRQTTTVVGIDNPKNKGIYVILPWHDSKLIPLGIMFKALGITDLTSIREIILGPNWKEDLDLPIITNALEYSYECQTNEDALSYIGKRCKIMERPSDKKKGDDAEGEGGDAEGGEEWDEKGEVDIELEDYAEGGDEAEGDEDEADVEDGAEDEVEALVEELEDLEVDLAEIKTREYMEKKKTKKFTPDQILARKILAHDLFPHLGEGDDPESFLKKARYLAYMTKKLVKTYSGEYPVERRDHYGNKRCITSGGRLGHQFMSALKRYTSEMYVSISKNLKNKGHLNVLGWATKQTTLTNHMVAGVSSNSWLFKVTGSPKGPKGLSQAYDIYSRLACITQVRKLRVPICDSGKVVGPRDLSGDHFANLCPETPEGRQSGLVKPTALSATVTIESDPEPIKNLIVLWLEDTQKFPEAYGWVIIFVNGDLVGYTNKPLRLAKYLRKIRRNGLLDPFVSVSYQEALAEFQVLSDAGRISRPLLIVEEGRLVFKKEHIGLSWPELLRAGVVEYLDVSEQDQIKQIAGYPEEITSLSPEEASKYSHCEIHPSLMFGAGIATIPFPDHNQAPRNVYQAQMSRQGIGVSFSNFRTRYYGSFNVLHYPEKPLVTTRTAEKIGVSEFPNGFNVIAAIMCSSFNEEDAIEMSQSSIDLGMFRDTHVCNFEMREKPVKGEKFGRPTFEEGQEHHHKKGNFRAINELGYAEVGSYVEKGDVVLCKMVGDKVEEVEVYKEPNTGRIDSIKTGIDADGYSFYRIRVHEVRTPVVGDKFAFRHAQKGVIGRITKTEDLPWTGYSGLRPDIVVNALAFPSRMTIALIIEAVFGIIVSSGHILSEYTIDEVWDDKFKPKLNTTLPDYFRKKYMLGDQVDGTPFRKLDLDDLTKELARLGITMGEQECYDGITGELISGKVMFAPIFNQRLKHVVQDKFHARATGALNSQTRQPPEGRGHDGGLKYGVMEADASNAAGIPYLTKDRLMDSSDATDVFFCGDCGSLAYRSKTLQVQLCQYCKSHRIVKSKIPYGTKLMNQELEALNIVPKIIPLRY